MLNMDIYSDVQKEVIDYIKHGGMTVDGFCSGGIYKENGVKIIRKRRSRKAGLDLLRRVYEKTFNRKYKNALIMFIELRDYFRFNK